MSGSEPGAPEREPPDLRLLPLVAGLWISQAAIVGSQPGTTPRWTVVGAAMVAVALGCGAALAREPGGRGRRRPGGPGGPARVRARLAAIPPGARVLVPGHWRGRPTVWVLGLAGVGLGLVVGSTYVARLHPEVVADVAAQSLVVQATARVIGDPRQHLPPADDGGRRLGPTWSAEARVLELTVRGRSYRLSIPVLLRGEQVRDLAYGAVVDLSGRAQAPFSPQTHAMDLRILGEVRERAPPGPVARATTAIRAAFARACAGIPVDAAALLMGLAVGDESLLTRELDDAMVLAGLSHLTAVSGSNTSLVCGIALALVAAIGVGWRGRVVVGGLALAGYVALVRPQPSVLRAAAMGVVALVALSTGGRRRGPPALLAAALVLLVWLPQFAVSLGFALSFAATAGLLVVGPPLADRLARWPGTRRVPEPVRAALAVAMAAHVATLPLAVLMGNGASLVALPANVLVTPLVPPATVVGLAAALVAPFLPAAASLLAHVAAPATGAIAWTAHSAAGLPFGVLPVAEGATGALGTTAVLLVTGWSVHRGWRPWRDRRVVAVALVVGVALVATRFGVDGRWPPPDWLVLACDVGQGDALLVRPQGSRAALLVDAGPDPGAVTDCIADAGIERLVVLITHFHADHIDGLAGVLDDWPVEALLVTTVAEPAEGAAAVSALAAGAGVPIHQLRAGEDLTVLGLPMEVLWPARRVAESPANNASVVGLVRIPTSAGHTLRVLLTGDAEPEAQTAMMGRPAPAADVVKVPHHGSRYQSPAFAGWTGASIALVSVGQGNDYGHPSAQTLEAYRKRGALVGRTDEQGALAVLMTPAGPALAVQR